MTKIHSVTITAMSILIVFCDRGWQFRAISSDGSMHGQANHYYTTEAAEMLVGCGLGLDGRGDQASPKTQRRLKEKP